MPVSLQGWIHNPQEATRLFFREGHSVTQSRWARSPRLSDGEKGSPELAMWTPNYFDHDSPELPLFHGYGRDVGPAHRTNSASHGSVLHSWCRCLWHPDQALPEQRFAGRETTHARLSDGEKGSP